MAERIMIVSCSQCGSKNRVDPETAEVNQPVCGKCGTLLDLSRAVNEEKKPVVVTDGSFQRDVVNASNEKPVVVDCWAEWCGPCRMLAPALDELARESAGRYRIAKLNVDENPMTSANFQIRSIPTLLIFKGGKMVDRIVGLQSKQVLAMKLAQH
ncbi:MAG: thioredoxin [Pyrinomonadaceae bacterium]